MLFLGLALALALGASGAAAQPAYINTTAVTTWKNFIAILSCPRVIVARPSSTDDVVAAIKSGAFTRVKAVGTGQSFNQWTCPAAAEGKRLVLDMQGMNRILALDKSSGTVLVEGGVRMGDLSRWLFGQGYTLKTCGRQINVTVAGALSTATHGSSVLHGTFSATVLGVEVVLGNGTVAVVDETTRTKNSKALLMPAFRASMGRLGVITKVNISVSPDYPVRRTVDDLPISTFLTDYLDQVIEERDLEKIESTNFFYSPHVSPDKFRFVRNDKEDTPEARASASSFTAFYNATRATSLPEYIPPDIQALLLNATAMTQIRQYDRPMLQRMFMYLGDETGLYPDLRWASTGQLAYYQATLLVRILLPFSPLPLGIKLDVYEVAVQMPDAKHCIRSLIDLYNSDVAYYDSIYAFMQIRFVKESKPVLLSPTLGKMAMYVNLDAYSVLQQGRQFYLEWNRVLDLMLGPDCKGVLHWGNNGPWNLYARSNRVSRSLAEPLKRFKAIADELDPKGLFETGLDSAFFK